MQENIWNNKNLIKVLKEGGVVIMPTDTIYGIVGKALEKNTVERIYSIKKRNPDKPCIILIGDIKELEKFGIILSKERREILENYWFTPSEVGGPGPVSVVLDHFAFRLPSPKSLRNLLLKTGPLIAPSANPEALLPAKNIEDAEKYFGNVVDPVRSRSPQGDRSTRLLTRAASNGVDLYIDGGELKNKPSKLIKLNNDGSIIVLRE